MAEKLDQTDVLAKLEQLSADIALVRGELATAKGQVTTITAERDTLKTENTRITGELTTAKGQVTTITAERDTLKTENEKLKTEKTTFETAVATKLATLGIADAKPAAAADAKAGDVKLTLTQKVLKAKGVTTLAELEAKRQPGIE